MIHRYPAAVPRIHPTAFVEASTHVIGDVELAGESLVATVRQPVKDSV